MTTLDHELNVEDLAPNEPVARQAEPLTNSRASCAMTCLMKHWFRFEIGIVPSNESEALTFGSAFHKSLEMHDLDTMRGDGVDTEVIFEMLRKRLPYGYDATTAMTLYLGHVWRWQEDQYEVLESERSFHLPLRNPETGRATPNWTNSGKRDRIVRLSDGRVALQEYKTTSDDIAPSSDYWMRLRLDGQVSRYCIAAKADGYDVETVVYDVTKKPTIRPKQVPLTDDEGFKIVLDVDGQRVRTANGKKWRESADTAAGYVLQSRLESEEEWAERLRSDIAERPDHYYARHQIARTAGDLAQFEAELWFQQLNLRSCQNTGRWFRNPNACVGFGTCEYLPICETHGGKQELFDAVLVNNQLIPSGYKLLTDRFPELNE